MIYVKIKDKNMKVKMPSFFKIVIEVTFNKDINKILTSS